MNKLIIILASSAVILGVFLLLHTRPIIVGSPNINQPIACTQEAKLCPDGSSVGRTGPQCQFAACPTVTAPGVKPLSSAQGISGTVLLGPTCPVMRNPPDPQCADKFFQTTLMVISSDGTTVAGNFASHANGKFKITLPSGKYSITSSASGNPYPRCASNGLITVTANTFTDTTVYCDTGIR